MLNQTITQILSDPTYDPPEAILSLNLNGDLKSILEQLSKEVCVAFAVGEAKLVLPIFEAGCPDDDRPRKAIEAAEEWLKDPSVASADAAVYAAAASADAAAASADAVDAADADAARAVYAAHAAHYAAHAAYSAHSAAYAAARAAHYAAHAAYAAAHAAVRAAAVVRAARHKDLYADQFDRLFKILKQYEVKN